MKSEFFYDRFDSKKHLPQVYLQYLLLSGLTKKIFKYRAVGQLAPFSRIFLKICDLPLIYHHQIGMISLRGQYTLKFREERAKNSCFWVNNVQMTMLSRFFGLLFLTINKLFYTKDKIRSHLMKITQIIQNLKTPVYWFSKTIDFLAITNRDIEVVLTCPF